MLLTAKKVLEQIINDDITFYALYTLDDDDEVEDFHTWVKANPNIGQTIRLDALQKEYTKAKLTPSELNNFITKNLNRYLDNLENWIPDEQYIKCQREITPPPGQRIKAFMGLDLSSTRDLASLVITFTDPVTGHMATIPEFYFPQNEVKRIRESGIDLGDWIQSGYIIEHETPTINQEKIFERIQYYNTIFEIVQINYDKWNSGFIIPKVERELYIYCKHFNQQTTWFNFPLKYIEKLMFSEELAMSINPVMRWQFNNIVLYYDGNGNIKIMKNKSKDSVDGPVAFAMAVGAWLEFNGDTTADFFREMMKSYSEE
jgi:phage terminase large subunit-like protein